MTWGLRVREQRGNASILMAGLMGVVVMLGSAAMVVAGYAAGYHRARSAADLAALSGAAAYGQGRDACGQAELTAKQNSARLVTCDQVGDAIDYVVTVQVRVAARTRVPGLPRSIEARAHAGPVR